MFTDTDLLIYTSQRIDFNVIYLNYISLLQEIGSQNYSSFFGGWWGEVANVDWGINICKNAIYLT